MPARRARRYEISGLRHWRPAVRSRGQCAGAQDQGHALHGDCPRWRDHATQARRTDWRSRHGGQPPIPKRLEARAERPVPGARGRELQCRLRLYMRAQAWWQKRLCCSRRLRRLSEQPWWAPWHRWPVPQLRARDTTLRLSVTFHVPESPPAAQAKMERDLFTVIPRDIRTQLCFCGLLCGHYCYDILWHDTE